MKKINIALILVASIFILLACKKEKKLIPPILYLDNTEISKEAQTVTMPIVTNINVEDIKMADDAKEWCSFKWEGSNIVVTVTANRLLPRTATFTLVGDVRTTLAYLNQDGYSLNDFREHDRTNWEVSSFCCEIESDGGGAKSILTDDNSTYWHNNWQTPHDLPHWIIIDMKEEADINMVRLGWRQYSDKYYYNNKVTNIYVGNVPDKDELLKNKIGTLTTLPVGTSHSSNQHKAFHNVGTNPVKGRYLMLYITESNAGQTTIVAYVKAYKYVGKN